MKKWFFVLLFIAALSVAFALPLYAARPSSVPIYYRVRWGDTLTSIAWRYCVSPWAIARWNNIPNPNLIYAGQILVIYPGCYYPPQPPCVFVHYVRPGETLLGIARMYGVSVWEIARLNGIFNLNLIYVGQRLLIPCWN
ncbi:MAG: LysM peptidoglycan-binding domain-containing protein [Anaerolineae bacterium]|nr:LysM peptidoglycan-binding domain-containing protein [Anaerolineae bacterium]